MVFGIVNWTDCFGHKEKWEWKCVWLLEETSMREQSSWERASSE